ncbi:hypothetical protein HOLleu_01518 [Holothuria leucospilota]|uniref:Uncharacterized protein n=1 Tax=Holothuria leucospilota TaxID=206669 RepID=A0A9Q1CQ18_HOLLE|nr:hypothetical protein HOLleu_01518 [Holothuria leucospilota]
MDAFSNIFLFCLMYSGIMDTKIQESILRCIPSITEESMEHVKAALFELGIEEMNDLVLVEEEDLVPTLKPIQARKLIASWRRMGEKASDQHTCTQNSSTPQKVLPEAVSPSSSPEGVSTSSKGVPATLPSHNTNWVSKYVVPWQKMPTGLISACEKGERPLPSVRREMVRKVVKDIHKITATPGKKNLDIIAERIVKKYPSSFRDEFEGRVVGSGFNSLAKQLLSRVENINRKPGNALRKRVLTSSCNTDDEGEKKRGGEKLDSYGCRNWQPTDYPPGETKDSQEEHRLWLVSEYGKANWTADDILQKMMLTYTSQRLWINGGKKNITELSEGWPFLFDEKFLFQHFHELVGIDLKQELLTSITEKAPKLFSCLKSMKRMQGVVRDTEAQCEVLQNKTPICTSVLHLLAQYFEEKIDLLVMTCEEGVRPEDLDVPRSPFLAAFGRNFAEAERFCLYVDGVAVNKKLHSFFGALTALFASFYCFNIEYPVEVSNTLEFIQRFFAGINPDRGSKTEKSKRKRTAVSSKILELTNTLTNFFSEWSMD